MPALQAVGGDGAPPRAGRGAELEGVAGGGGVVEVEFGEDVGLAEALVAIAREAVRVVGSARTALAAEQAVSHLLGMADQAAPPEATDQDRAAARNDLLAGLIAWAASDASPAALAFLRVAAVLGEASTRQPASAAAERLAAAGVEDRRWAAIVGRPRLVWAWWYGDLFGVQESVNLLFDYNHREHCVCVLIDHQLGGGVKDCWIAEGRAAAGLRARMSAMMADRPEAQFGDIDAARALQVLHASLARPVCPEQPDQIEDVTANLEILRARVSLMTQEPSHHG
jgi:hypothetical protein